MEEKLKIDYVKAMTEEENEGIVSTFLGISKEAILNRLYPYVSDDVGRVWLSKYDYLQCRLAVYFLNKQGAEGETSHNENGVNRSYGTTDIPNDILCEITPFGK